VRAYAAVSAHGMRIANLIALMLPDDAREG
jgi:hypothetical protein